MPHITEGGPHPPWMFTGVIPSDEKAFHDESQRLQHTKGGRTRTVDFYLQVHTPTVSIRAPGTTDSLAFFEPNGLWVAVDLTAAGSIDGTQFAVFTKRVRAAALVRRAPEAHPGLLRRPLAQFPLRGSASPGSGVLKWGYRASRE